MCRLSSMSLILLLIRFKQRVVQFLIINVNVNFIDSQVTLRNTSFSTTLSSLFDAKHAYFPVWAQVQLEILSVLLFPSRWPLPSMSFGKRQVMFAGGLLSTLHMILASWYWFILKSPNSCTLASSMKYK